MKIKNKITNRSQLDDAFDEYMDIKGDIIYRDIDKEILEDCFKTISEYRSYQKVFEDPQRAKKIAALDSIAQWLAVGGVTGILVSACFNEPETVFYKSAFLATLVTSPLIMILYNNKKINIHKILSSGLTKEEVNSVLSDCDKILTEYYKSIDKSNIKKKERRYKELKSMIDAFCLEDGYWTKSKRYVDCDGNEKIRRYADFTVEFEKDENNKSLMKKKQNN